MRNITVKRIIGLVILLGVVAFSSSPAAMAGDGDHTPTLPSPLCDDLRVPEGNQVALRAYARGVQIYRWNGTSWVFVAPLATLYADENFHAQIGTHYAGPTWESNSGSKVVAGDAKRCFPDPTVIPWLRLQTVSTTGPGIFSSITFVHRVETTGGAAPATPGEFEGQSVEIPYTAVYFFYRAQD